MTASARETINNSDVVVVSKKNAQFQDEIMGLNGDKIVIDLVRMMPDLEKKPPNYEGICW
jgi:hypothetical protein